MTTGKKTSNAFLIAANLVPLIGVLFLGWDGKGIIVVYILETIIIGILNALKMLTVYFLNGTKNEPASTGGNVSGWGLIPFFLFHYNFFIFVQSVLFFAFSSMWEPHNGPEPFNVIANFSKYVSGNNLLALSSLLIANLAYFINDFILSGAYQKETMAGLMFQPYKRIFLQQFLVIFGGFIFMLTGGISIVMGLFVILKIAADYLTANYGNNPKVANWIKSKVTEGNGKELTEEQKTMVENMFGDGKK